MNASSERTALLAVAALGIATTAIPAPWWIALVLASALALVLVIGLARSHNKILPAAGPTPPDSPAVPPTGSSSGFTGVDAPLATSDPDDTGTRFAAIASAARLALDSSDDIAVADRVARIVCSTFGVASCEVYRVSDGAVELVAGVRSGHRAERGVLAPGSDPLAEQGSVSPVAVFASDDGVSADPVARQFATGVAVPITGTGRGALVVRSIIPRAFTDTDVAFLRTLATVLALGDQRRGAERNAMRSTRQDTLTGLVNRGVFLDRLRSSLTRARRQQRMVAVMLIDIDNFKVVNESLGHAAGDTVLESCSNHLSAALRPGDVLARFGGDEFVVLASGLTTVEAAAIAADRLRAAVEAPVHLAGREVRVTASVGLAIAEGDPTAEELLQYADAALHEAKNRGRERVERFTPALLDEAVTRLRTEGELRDALTHDQLRVFYQPIVDLHTGQTVAAEALVRWLRPGRGLVTPAEFIPISESTGLIEEIGAWVIGEAVAQAGRWAAEGRPMQVSVNLAQRQLGDPRLLSVIDQALDAHRLSPSLLAVELTEGTVMADRATTLNTLQQIAARGISIAIDDFGTGYSSMAYLQTLPVDVVKIDRSFVSGVDRSKSDYAITSAMIQVCRALGKTVVAEGVETEQQLELLRDLNCDQAQGYLFSPAVIDLQPPSTQESWSQLIIGRL